MAAPTLDMDRLIDDRRTRIIVCCGSGGVGKAPAAAAIGLRAAARGPHAVGLTGDPPRAPSAGGPPNPAGTRAYSPSTRPGGWPSRWDCPRWTTPPARWTGWTR